MLICHDSQADSLPNHDGGLRSRKSTEKGYAMPFNLSSMFLRIASFPSLQYVVPSATPHSGCVNVRIRWNRITFTTARATWGIYSVDTVNSSGILTVIRSGNLMPTQIQSLSHLLDQLHSNTKTYLESFSSFEDGLIDRQKLLQQVRDSLESLQNASRAAGLFN